MRVLFVEHKEILGGGQVVLLNLWREWARQRAALEPLVVCPPNAALEPRVRALDLRCETFDLGAMDKTRGIAWNLARRVAPTRRLRETLRAFQPDAVCANGAFSFLACAFAASLARVPVVWFEHNNKTLPDDRIVRWLIHQAARIVVVSEMLHAQFVSLAPQAQNKIALIHNGVDVERFNERSSATNHVAARRRIIAELGWDETTPIVGTVSRLSPEKGIDDFLDAARLIQQTVPNARFLIVGDGPQRAELERRMTSDGRRMTGAVCFLGFRDDVPELLSAMEVFVLPSHAEAFPLAVLEAMAAARPVVATTVGDVAKAVVNGENGLLVLPRDAGAIAGAVCDLLRDENRRRVMGERGRARVEQQFTLEQQARAMLAVFRAAVK